MINRLLFVATFVAIGVLTAGWWHNRSLIEMQKAEKIAAFMSAGPRFTAEDGQRLCERIAELEKHSIGFQRSGIVSPPCNYMPK